MENISKYQSSTNLDNAPIFNFIKPYNNDDLLKINFSLQELQWILNNNFYLQLRKDLSLNKNITMGFEIESEHSSIPAVKNEFYNSSVNSNWKVIHDWTLKDGVEVCSPILIDEEKSWQDLKQICSILESVSSIDQNSGAHIHIGSDILKNKPETWLNLIKLWSVYENIIFRFSYGEWLSARSTLQKYAKPMAKYFWSDYTILKKDHASLEEILFRLSRSKYQAINFCNICLKAPKKKKNTIEFRCPNGTLTPEVWQNNTNFFVSILNYCQSNHFNDDIVQKRFQTNIDNHLNLQSYDEINLDQALELCDMIFTLNLDKMYFLKQYLKSSQMYQKSQDLPKMCILTKNTNNKNITN